MGMNLDEQHILLTEEDYKALKEGRLYIKNPYELKIISWLEGQQLINSAYYTAFEDYCNNLEGEKIKIEITKPIKTFIEKECYYSLDNCEIPISLEEFLNYDYCGEWIINELSQEEIYGKKVYVLTQVRYW